MGRDSSKIHKGDWTGDRGIKPPSRPLLVREASKLLMRKNQSLIAVKASQQGDNFPKGPPLLGGRSSMKWA